MLVITILIVASNTYLFTEIIMGKNITIGFM